jgi:hypothetical protein
LLYGPIERGVQLDRAEHGLVLEHRHGGLAHDLVGEGGDVSAEEPAAGGEELLVDLPLADHLAGLPGDDAGQPHDLHDLRIFGLTGL